MNTNVINNFLSIREYIKKNCVDNEIIKIIAVSKTFGEEKILPLLKNGNIHFGENKVQEAEVKWISLKQRFPNARLHMIGRLQSNKAKKAIQLFDFIHSLDNQKLADVLSNLENNNGKRIKYFIQVNLGSEDQKAGIQANVLDDFYTYCVKEKKLDVIGLMAIPPNDGNQEIHFKYLRDATLSLGLKELSMGMSGDYKIAIKYKSTFLRIGSSIFGNRT